jgi:ABC-type multidrug transport system fused ATPase/permease subunit
MRLSEEEQSTILLTDPYRSYIMPCILKNIKLIIKKLNSFIKSLTFSFRISYDSNKHYFLKRIIMQMFEGLVPIINVFLAKEIINNIVNAVNTNADVYYTLSSNIILLFIVNILNGIVSTYSEVYANIHKDIITNYINVQINSKVSSLDML